MSFRMEHDTMGEVRVPSDKYWGAQTQRSKDNFKIGTRKMPKEVVYAFAYLKKAAAMANYESEILPKDKMELIKQVCDEILEGKLDDTDGLVSVETPRLSWWDRIKQFLGLK